MYHIISRKSIDTALLMKISVALEVDSFECFKPLMRRTRGGDCRNWRNMR